MSLLLGIGTSTEGYDRLQDLRDLSAPVSRFVLTAGADWLPGWHARNGARVHGVVAAETFRGFGLDPQRVEQFRACVLKVKALWGAQLDYLEIGNEPDDPGGSSYRMTPTLFSWLLEAFQGVFHEGQHETPVLISGGLNSGQPSYAELVTFPECMLLGLHDYDSRLRGWPSPGWGNHDLDFYLGAYASIWRRMRGVAVTEWGHTSQDEVFGAEYVRRWLAIARAHPEVQLAEFFSLYDRQHPPHGLVADGGRRKAQFGAYADEITRAPDGDASHLWLLSAPAVQVRGR